MKKFLTLAVILTVLFSSCTDNQRARNFGGTETIKLEPRETVYKYHLEAR
jgi:hypothetical protein